MDITDLLKEINKQANDKIEATWEWFNESVKLIEEKEEKEKKFGKPLKEIFGYGHGRPPVGGLSKPERLYRAGGGTPEDIGQGKARAGEKELGITPFGPEQSKTANVLGADDVEKKLTVGSRAVVDYNGERFPAVVTFADPEIYEFKPAIHGKGKPVSVEAKDMSYALLPNGNFSVKIFK